MKFKIYHIDELTWHGKIGKKPICEFEYFKDARGRFWINKIDTWGNYKQKGYGTKMIKAALKAYKEIYVSTAKKTEILNRKIQDNDFRYTNDEHLGNNSPLMLIVQKCVDKGILKPEWIKHPFNDV
jgi:hypothetical protein